MSSNLMKLKRSAAAVAASSLMRPMFSPLMRGRVVIFMLHRFTEVERSHVGHTPADLRRALEIIRRSHIPVLTLREVVERGAANGGLRGVVFTVDDGYQDFDDLAAPVFRAMDCPVTVFLTTGFVDGLYWFWWDRISYALKRTSARRIVLSGPTSQVISVGSANERIAAQRTVVNAIKQLPERHREALIQGILEQLDVPVPDRPPEEFRPLAWSRIRWLAANGVEFGPHSVHHPTVATIEPGVVSMEVRESHLRLQQEIPDPVPVFCYPYGLSMDVSTEAARAVASAGMIAAVTARPGYVDEETLADPLQLPRFAFSHESIELRQILFGVQRFKDLVRQWTRR